MRHQALSGASDHDPHEQPPVVTPQVAAEAAMWVSRLHGPSRSRQMELDCLAWQAKSAANRHAFERCTDTWQDIPSVSVSSAYAASASSPTVRARGWQGPRRLAAGLTLGVFLLGGTAVLVWQQWRAGGVYSTGVGEQQVVLLEDGTRMSLNTATEVAVDLDARRRLVSVREGGEVLFEVAKDPRRPFVVRAGGSEIVALGTSFSVRVGSRASEGDKALAVTLLEGKVSVRSAAQEGQGSASVQPVVMQPGERLRLGKPDGAKVVVTRDRPRPEQVLAWRRSEVVFDDVSLSQAVEEMNRYSRTPIVLAADSAVGARRVSGQYRTGDNMAFAQAVATLHGLKLDEGSGRLELSLPHPDKP